MLSTIFILALVLAHTAASACPYTATPASWPPATSFATGTNPAKLRTAYINNDTLPDIVVLSTNARIIDWWRGTGNVADPFVDRTEITSAFSPSTPSGLALLDANVDGAIDVAVSAGPSIFIFLGSTAGGGSFPTSTPSITLTMPVGTVEDLVAAQLDGAGAPDLVIGGGLRVAVAFAPFVAVPTIVHGTAASNGVAAGDVDGDGYVDVVVASTTGDTVALLNANNTGVFAPAPTPLTTSASVTSPIDPTMVDLNGDGRLDLVVRTTAAVYVALQLGSPSLPGSFQTPVVAASVSSIFRYAVADFNGDAVPDIGVAHTSNNLNMYYGNGAGAFGTAHLITSVDTAFPYYTGLDMIAVDVDGDAIADPIASFGNNNLFVVIASSDRTPHGYAPTTVLALTSVRQIAFGRVDGDHMPDLVAAISDCAASCASAIRWFKRTGPTTVATSSPTTIIDGFRISFAVAVGDFNNDQYDDVAAAVEGMLVVARNAGGALAGIFIVATIGPTAHIQGTEVNIVDAVDFNGDGFLDIIVATISTTGSFGVFSHIHTGSPAIDFAPGQLVVAGNPVRSVAYDDVDGDGDVDIVVTRSVSPTDFILYFAFNASANAFPSLPTATITVPVAHHAVGLGDFNGDGWLDIAAVRADAASLAVYPSTGPGQWGSPVAVVGATMVSSTVTNKLVVVDLNQDGVLDFVTNDQDLVKAFIGRSNWPPRVRPLPYQPSTTTAERLSFDVYDVSGDGLLDIVFVIASSALIDVSTGFTHTFAHATSPHTFALNPAGVRPCVAGQSAGASVACLSTLLSSTSPCAVDSVTLPAGTFSNCPLAPYALPTAVDVHAPPQGTHVACVASPPGDGLDDGARVWSWSGSGTVSITGVAFSGLAASALVADAPSATLALANVTATGPGPLGESNGPLAATGGGTLALTHVNATLYSALRGGAVFVGANSTATVVGSTFASNSASSGGAVYAERGAAIAIVGSSFATNSAGSGGALAADAPSSLTVTATVFDANVATTGDGGAMAVVANGTAVTVAATTSTSNAASAAGGFLHIVLAPGSLATDIDIRMVSASGDSAGTTGGFAHVAAPGSLAPSPVVFEDVSVTGSSAGQGGGALAFVLDKDGADVTLRALTLASTTAAYGGALFVASPGYAVGSSAVGRHIPVPNVGRAAAATLAADGVAITGGSAELGGGVFECGVLVGASGPNGLTVAGSSASAAGGAGFACAGDVASFGAGGPPLGGGAANAVGGSGYGAQWATPGERVVWLVEPPGVAASGAVLSAVAAEVVDGVGQRVRDDGALFELVATTGVPGAVAVVGGVVEQSGSSELALGNVALSLVGPVFAETEAVLRVRALDAVRSLASADAERTVVVELCGVGAGGTVDPGSQRLTCSPCGLTDTSTEVSAAPCSRRPPCPESTVLVSVSTNTTGGTESAPACVCKSGFWAQPGRAPDAPCAPCPTGAVCELGIPPYPQKGHFADTDGSFVACKRAAACAGGEASACNKGYSGYMCNTCVRGYYSAADGRCVACPSGAVSGFAAAVVIVVVVAVGVATAVAWALTRAGLATGVATGEAKTTGELIRAFRRQSVPASPSLVLVSFQLIGVIADANLGWTTASRAVLNTANVANIDSNLFASECALSTFHTKYAMSLVLPLTFLVVVFCSLVLFKTVLAHAVAFLATMAAMRMRTLVDAVVFTVAPLLYVPVARVSLTLFDCTKLPSGQLVLDTDPGVECFDSKWWTVFPLGAAVVIGYLVGLPVYVGTALFARRARLFEPLVTQRYGALYRTLRRGFYWFEVANIAKRLVLVLAAIFLSTRQLALIFVMLGVLVASLVFSVYTEPYYFPTLNRLDRRMNGLLLALVIVGAGAYAERASNATDTFFLIAAILLLVCIVAVAAHGIVTEIRLIIRERNHGYLAAAERTSRLMGVITRELLDVEAGPDLLRSAGQFLANLERAAHAGELTGAVDTVDPSGVQMDDLCE